MHENQKSPQIATVLADLDSMPFREPVISEMPQVDSVNRAWTVTTELARRGIIESPDIRAAAKDFVALPLDESLASEAVEALAPHDPRIARAAKLGGSLMTLLKAAPVPDELLKPDIYHAPSLTDKQSTAEMLHSGRQGMPEGYYDRRLAETLERVTQRPGVSEAERQLVALRYRYGREAKLLGLMAELHDEPLVTPVKEAELIQHELHSGVTLVMTSETFEVSPGLLNPEKWQSKVQIKDRVHRIVVDGKSYIMKERKTNRHTDTKNKGHVDGATSQEEFATALEFSKLGTISSGDIRLRWEKPLGYVEFPDGYQFCVFEYDAAADNASGDPSQNLQYDIMNRPEAYQAEFDDVKQAAAELMAERADDLFHNLRYDLPPQPSKWSRSNRKKAYGIAKDELNVLTFEEFAVAKSRSLDEDAIELLSNTMEQQGYTNSDIDGYAFTVDKSGERVVLNITGFDFEYYKKDPEAIARRQAGREENQQSGTDRIMGIAGDRSVVKAAEYALGMRSGRALPKRAED